MLYKRHNTVRSFNIIICSSPVCKICSPRYARSMQFAQSHSLKIFCHILLDFNKINQMCRREVIFKFETWVEIAQLMPQLQIFILKPNGAALQETGTVQLYFGFLLASLIIYGPLCLFIVTIGPSLIRYWQLLSFELVGIMALKNILFIVSRMDENSREIRACEQVHVWGYCRIDGVWVPR